jgi:flavin reductase (DIM6/NTAB) family NADH-FMN oxidoreductase RutF
MMTVNPQDISVGAMHNYLLSAVIPRPIALASTVDASGRINLSPFSFFNCFGANPPLLVFSPGRRARDNTTKHTYENVLEVREVVIHIVNYAMVQQTSLASTEYEKGVNEFVKAGFTEERSVLVSPPRVKESPIAFECRVLDVIRSGDQGGAGNLVLCEVLLMHIREDVLGEDGRIDPVKLDAVARLGADWYARIGAANIFKVPKPLTRKGIGIDQLPVNIRMSSVLTGNELAMLANVTDIPEAKEDDTALVTSGPGLSSEEGRHRLAKELLQDNKVEEAWQVLLYKTKNPA